MQEKLVKLRPYVTGLKFTDDGFTYIEITIKQGWILKKYDNIDINNSGEGDPLKYIIYSNSCTIDELIGCADDLINTNLDNEKKEILFKEKINELKMMFDKSSYEESKRIMITLSE